VNDWSGHPVEPLLYAIRDGYADPDDAVFQEACYAGVPILLYHYQFILSLQNRYSRLLFHTRDCCYLHALFKQLHPGVDCELLYASRSCYRRGSPDFVAYALGRVPDNAMIVDMHGSGEAPVSFFASHGRKVTPVFFERYFKADDPGYPTCVGSYKLGGVPACIGGYSECLNYVDFGSVKDVHNGQPMFAAVEYDPLVVRPIQYCVEQLLNYLQRHPAPNMGPPRTNVLRHYCQSRVLLPYHKVTHD